MVRIIKNDSYKIGVDEIVGLKKAMEFVLSPVQKSLRDKIYWSDCEFESVEYKRRDGFIPHSHNCGGVELSVHIPKCEEYGFGSVEFGECDDNECECHNEDGNGECGYENEGYLDAFLRIRLKFEGLDEKGVMKFYLFAEGGNNDAPYYRNVPTLFETEFTAKNMSDLRAKAKKHIQKLIKEVL